MLPYSTLCSSQEGFFWPLVVRGVGLSCLFVPLTTVALSNLKGPDIGQGTGPTNMMRQLGGSFGIALVATYIDRQPWANRTSLLRNLSPFDPAAVSWLKQVTAGFVSRGVVPLEAQRKALGALEGTLSRQVALLTFMDAFRLVGLSSSSASRSSSSSGEGGRRGRSDAPRYAAVTFAASPGPVTIPCHPTSTLGPRRSQR